MATGDEHSKRNRRKDQTSEAGVRFFQRRVALFGLVGFALGAVFLAFRVITTLLGSDVQSLAHPSMVFHLLGACALLASWMLCRGAPRSKVFVETVEVVSLGSSALAYSVMGVYLAIFIRPEMVTTLAMTMGVLARAVFVPSTAKRTAILTAIVGVPVIVAAYYTHAVAEGTVEAVVHELHSPAAVALSTAVWWLLSLSLATMTSHVIYGLRRQIRQARKLGQYTLEHKLGEGGMGVVYRASHAMLRRPTAIKLLPSSKAGEQAIARFEREVRLTARLTHPNTVTVFDYGRTPDGIFYYAMELLDGATLEEIAQLSGAQPPARVLHMLTATAGALSEAHRIGLIHRDIKPANVMMCRRGGEVDVPKLLDFGLVKDLESSHTLTLTTTNTLTGTPLYMPPEAIVNPEEVDGRSDIYALGAVGYFMLTGTHVFEGDSVVEVCSRHIHAKPEPPSERLGEPVPEDLSAAILSCLAKEPKDRPTDAAQLKARLLACKDANTWTQAKACAWWNAHAERLLGTRSESRTSSSEETIEVELGRRSNRPPSS